MGDQLVTKPFYYIYENWPICSFISRGDHTY
jgi:hypothetical protein